MGKSILDSCGRYTEKLLEISESIIKTRTESGEKVTETDVWTIDSNIFEAYQLILGTVKDPNIISKSIENLKETIKTTGSISNINSIAIASVEKSIEEQGNIIGAVEASEKVGTAAVFGTVGIITDVMQDGSLNDLDSFLNTEVVNNLDNEIQKAKNGDNVALGEIEVFKGAAEVLGKYDKLDEKKTRETLARMMGLAASDSPISKKMLEELANKFSFDILKKDEEGKTIIDEDKLTKLYQSKVQNLQAPQTIEDFKKVIEKKAERVKEIPENGTQLSSQIKGVTKEKKVKESLSLALKEGNEDALVILCEKYPEEIKSILNKRIDAINKAQELGKKISPKIQESVLEINNAMKLVKETVKVKETTDYDNAR